MNSPIPITDWSPVRPYSDVRCVAPPRERRTTDRADHDRRSEARTICNQQLMRLGALAYRVRLHPLGPQGTAKGGGFTVCCPRCHSVLECEPVGASAEVRPAA